MQLGSRFFGARSTGADSFPVIDVSGRPLQRTWSVLATPVAAGQTTISLLHDPVAMGWLVGDRVVISPTTGRSAGYTRGYTISALNSVGNTVTFSNATDQAYAAVFQAGRTASVAVMSAEVINLSRNVIITGDDFRHIPCDASLENPTPLGCACDATISKTQCTAGLHTLLSGAGLMRMQYTRVEKCGQRGIMGRYCLHLHLVGHCPNCLFKGNAVEFGHQRGIVVHDSHSSLAEDNVLNDVRGAGIYLEDGNELFNRIQYNVVICPWPGGGNPPYYGCSIPGTSCNGSVVWISITITRIIALHFTMCLFPLS